MVEEWDLSCMDTPISSVRLLSTEPPEAVEFYTDALGLIQSGGEKVGLRPQEGELLVEVGEASSESRGDEAGIFHLGLRLPSRRDLGNLLLRLRDLGYPIEGTADHLVTESLYLSDRDGNGLELYADRPREEWRWSDGEVEMATEPLDLESLEEEADGAAPLPEGTEVGHLHLETHDLAAAVGFYRSLGLEVRGRMEDAAFLALGRYHHHVALNTWHGRSGPRREGAAGLTGFRVELSGEEGHRRDGGVARDPDGIEVDLD